MSSASESSASDVVSAGEQGLATDPAVPTNPALPTNEVPASVSTDLVVLATVQAALAGRPGVISAARGLSHFGEHALGWMAVSGLGAALDRKRRKEWLGVGVGAVGAHAASIVIKRVVRRPRPDSPAVQVNVSTPSKLSFPSSHATSTTAAAILLGRLTGLPVPLAVVPPMLISRLVLGVHYPTDVLAGAALGAASAAVVTGAQRRFPRLRTVGAGVPPRVCRVEGDK